MTYSEAAALIDSRAEKKIASLSREKQHITDLGADIIRNGGLVAFPTETVYGLGADALNSDAVARIYETKGRPSDNPLILHVASLAMTDKLVELNDNAVCLMEHFWPGPLSIVLPAREIVPMRTRGGLSTAAVRMPDMAAALALIKKSGLPIAAPSANISGRPSPTDAATVISEIGDKIPLVIDGGDTKFGVESTVIDMTGKNPVLLRAGGASKEEIEDVLSLEVLMPQDGNIIKRSPGTRYRHYAPKVPLILSKNGDIPQEDAQNSAWLGTSRPSIRTKKEIIFKNNSEYAKELFRALRKAESCGVKKIYAEMPDENGIGRALKDRLVRAAGD